MNANPTTTTPPTTAYPPPRTPTILPTLPPLPRLSPAHASAAWAACLLEASDDARYPPVAPVRGQYSTMEEMYAARKRGEGGDESMVFLFCYLASNRGSRGLFLRLYLPFALWLPHSGVRLRRGMYADVSWGGSKSVPPPLRARTRARRADSKTLLGGWHGGGSDCGGDGGGVSGAGEGGQGGEGDGETRDGVGAGECLGESVGGEGRLGWWRKGVGMVMVKKEG